MTKYADWYPGSVKPVRPGAYEVTEEDDAEEQFSWWDGRYWNSKWPSPWWAKAHDLFGEMETIVRWRGLREPS
jgi:hypothetical protein